MYKAGQNRKMYISLYLCWIWREMVEVMSDVEVEEESLFITIMVEFQPGQA